MGGLELTTPRQTVVAVLSGAVFAWLGLRILERLDVLAPVVPWTLPATLLGLAVAGFVYALQAPGRLERRTLRAREGFVAVVTGKAMVITGAMLAGVHAVVVMENLTHLGAPLPSQRVWGGLATIVASLLVAAAGTMIEHRLALKDPPDDPEEQAESAA